MIKSEQENEGCYLLIRLPCGYLILTNKHRKLFVMYWTLQLFIILVNELFLINLLRKFDIKLLLHDG
ncbi:hypothetical protein SAMN04488542_10366 [Fontibacillus panacisegetis]|uniref:Uncharacterized protein n=1 Tax=Fontibacillus panacisegetis TaxID=670482 RepID=A0A1G7GIA8_9BACL|nr:hypothetical protein SAMN04488542_10366 [Fontibacillus panacisegetis]